MNLNYLNIIKFSLLIKLILNINERLNNVEKWLDDNKIKIKKIRGVNKIFEEW